MIILFSVANDYTTYDVIKWLHYLGEYNIVRVNYGDAHGNKDLLIQVEEGDFKIRLQDKVFSLRDIKAVWYRKGCDWLCDQFYTITIEGHTKFTRYLNNKAQREQHKLSEYLHFLIENSVPVLGSAFKSDLNKLITLSAAKAAGLLIPDFHVVNHKQAVEQLWHTGEGFISKSMSDGVYLFDKTEAAMGYFTYTEKLTEEKIQELPDKISPSFLQKNIEKRMEVRVFFLDNRCYSMAIFSQSDEKTKVDYRKYNDEKPNRCVPFILPSAIAAKIIFLFNTLGLNTGSVDLIMDTKGDFYFLEINPVGQFGMVSNPCNYQLEKKVALKLLEYARRTTKAEPEEA